jgi:hypothetical protein
MTKLLEQAFAKAQSLPDSEQDAIAQVLMEEMESERHWDDLIARSGPQLRKLADEAWAEHAAGRSEPLDPDAM